MSSKEWLANLIKESDKKGYSLQLSKLDEWVKQAKVMHKRELQKSFLKNDNSVSIFSTLERFEQYYNETFKQQ